MSQAPQRRETIRTLVRKHRIQSQEELQKLLRKEGFRVTQPTLSRDIRELGLAKTPAGYVLPEDLGTPSPVVSFRSRGSREERLDQTVREYVTSVAISGTIVVIRTPPAGAQPVALAIDSSGLDEVLGTIGGDDTIFVATPDEKSASRLAHRLSSHLTPGRARRTRV